MPRKPTAASDIADSHKQTLSENGLPPERCFCDAVWKYCEGTSLSDQKAEISHVSKAGTGFRVRRLRWSQSAWWSAPRGLHVTKPGRSVPTGTHQNPTKFNIIKSQAVLIKQ